MSLFKNFFKKIRDIFYFPTQHEISMKNLKNYRGQYTPKVEEVKTTISLCEQLLQLDHMDHEWIIRVLQERAEPLAIPYLKQAIELKPQLEYLSYDDYGAFYKRCLWALQAIGTAEAINLIEEYTHSDKEELAEQARHRIYRINGGT